MYISLADNWHEKLSSVFWEKPLNAKCQSSIVADNILIKTKI